MSDMNVPTKAVFRGEVVCPVCCTPRQPFTGEGTFEQSRSTFGKEFYCTTPDCGYLFKATLTVEGKRKVGDHEDHSV